LVNIVPSALQPRKDFRARKRLQEANRFRFGKHGIIQPLIVPTGGALRFELIAGERRWPRGPQEIGLTEVPAIVRSANEPGKLLELSLIEICNAPI